MAKIITIILIVVCLRARGYADGDSNRHVGYSYGYTSLKNPFED